MSKEKSAPSYDSSRMKKIDLVACRIFTVLTWLSIVATAYIMIITTVNVISRSFFSYAVNGSVQTSQIMLSLCALCALPIVTMYNSHIKVDLVADRLSAKAQKILTYFNLLICSAMMFIMGYYTFFKAASSKASGMTMDVPKFPHWPIYTLIAIMLIASGLCGIYNIIHYRFAGTLISPDLFFNLRKNSRKEKKGESR